MRSKSGVGASNFHSNKSPSNYASVWTLQIVSASYFMVFRIYIIYCTNNREFKVYIEIIVFRIQSWKCLMLV